MCSQDQQSKLQATRTPHKARVTQIHSNQAVQMTCYVKDLSALSDVRSFDIKPQVADRHFHDCITVLPSHHA